jgi:hypothetical protein
VNHIEASEEAAQQAWLRLRHLLRPDTVHLLTQADLADAIGLVADKMVADQQATADRVEGLLRELDNVQRENTRVREERDEALRVADILAYSVGALTSENLGTHQPGNNPWQRALDLLDEIAVANNRARPSDMYYGEVSA